MQARTSRLIGLVALAGLLAGPVGAQDTPAISYEQLSVPASAVSLARTTTNPAGKGTAQYCTGQVETADIRIRVDGTAASATVGNIAQVGSVVELQGADPILKMSAFAVSGTGTLNMTCYGAQRSPWRGGLVVSPPTNPGVSTTGTGSEVHANSPTIATPTLTSATITTATITGGTLTAPIFTTPSLAPGGTTTGTVGSSQYLAKTVTALVDNTFTDILTVTIPNSAHAATLAVVLHGLLGAGGAVGAGECSATAYGQIVFTRTAGVAAVGTATALSNTGSACVAGATTIAFAYQLSAVGGAVGATNTFTVQARVTKGAGSSANHVVLAEATLLNWLASGVTIQ